MPDTGWFLPGTLPRMQKTGETCERDGLYEGRCGCARWLPLGESGVFPSCPMHGPILWQALELEAAPGVRRSLEPSARGRRAVDRLADVA